ncbi:hypothetical protein F6B41_22350 [Microbacterium lushaniae]|nr:hypothetical protein F6B41_32995 [Microbacterium lushaniae]KAA9150652.1 hypothetical protein F6B41_22350 [Microbacterium lushaniae]
MRSRRSAVALALSILAGATIAGCASSTPEQVCVPELAVTPDAPRPGRIVTVQTVRACPAEEGVRWEVRIQPEDATIPLARAFVEPEADGSFAVRITVPPTIGAGPAIAHIANYWESATCPDGASCAAASVTFEVRE